MSFSPVINVPEVPIKLILVDVVVPEFWTYPVAPLLTPLTRSVCVTAICWLNTNAVYV